MKGPGSHCFRYAKSPNQFEPGLFDSLISGYFNVQGDCMQGRQVLTTTYVRSVGGRQDSTCGQRRGAPIASVARALMLRMVCLSLLLPCSITNVTALDLSLPKDILGEGRQRPIERGELMGEALGSERNSPAVSLYTDNVKETIKRRLHGAFPRDGVGRVICGEASYAMMLRTDGSIDRLEVVPVRRGVESSGTLETYFVQPTPGYRNAGSARYTQPVATDEEALGVFAQTIADLLRSIAPYPARSKLETVPSGQKGIQSQAPLVLITGSIGVKCSEWKVNQ